MKESNKLIPDTNGETLTPQEGTLFPVKSLDFPSFRYPQLAKLSQRHDELTSGKNAAFSRISIETLEILEAELCNQEVLPRLDDYSETLTQLARHDINILVWRARRAGGNTRNLTFKISLRNYVLEKAREILTFGETIQLNTATSSLEKVGTAWGLNIPSKNEVATKLNYLEQFATYLNGELERSQNPYRKALNLLLRTLNLRDNTISETSIQITLPIETSLFLSRIRTNT